MQDLIKKFIPYILTALVGSGVTLGLGEYAQLKCVAIAKNPIAEVE